MKIKSILIGILVGAVSIPTLAMGGSMVSSLIDGLSPSEAVNVLATQIDSLIGRVEVVETKQAGQDQIISELQKEAQKNLLMQQIKETCGIQPFPGIDECIQYREEELQNYNRPANWKYHPDKLKSLKEQLLSF